MPYITKERSRELYVLGDGYQFNEIKTKGELNLVLTEIMVDYLRSNGKSYQTISDVIAAAQDAADEMKRRVLAPYEDDKRFDPNNIDPYEGL